MSTWYSSSRAFRMGVHATCGVTLALGFLLGSIVLSARPALAQRVPTSVRWVAKPDSAKPVASQLMGFLVEAVDSANKPVPGATLEVIAGSSAASLGNDRGLDSARVTTDSTGRALLNNVRLIGANRWVSVAVRAANGVMTEAVPVRVAGSAIDRLTIIQDLTSGVDNGKTFATPPQFEVSLGGRPVRGVHVTLVLKEGNATLDGNEAESDERGLVRFPSFRVAATSCTESGCPEQTIVARAGDLESTPMVVSPRLRLPTRIVVLPESGKELVAYETLIPGIKLRAIASDDTSVPGVMIEARDRNGALLGSESTDALGFATIKNVTLHGRAGAVNIVLSAGSTQQSYAVRLLPGLPQSVSIVTEPPPRVVFDSAWTSHPVVQVRDRDGNPVPNVEVHVSLCGGSLPTTARDSTRIWCPPPATLLGSLQGTAIVRTDSSGRAEFADLRLRGRSGEYQLEYTVPEPFTARAKSSVIRYKPRRDYDQNFVVISAIKTISGAAPKDEFFDLRFRFRLGTLAHVLANTDVALSARGTDSVSSPQERITEASLMMNRNLFMATEYSSDVPQRLIFGGAELKVFNTIQYYGMHIGGTELGGSPFQGSLLTIGYLRRWYNDSLAVVNGDSLKLAKNNIGVDFFVRSSAIEFFKVLTIRGSVLIPLGNKARPMSRIAIAVPVGDVHSF